MAQESNNKKTIEKFKEFYKKARACKTADELMKLTETEGFSVTKDQAEAFLSGPAKKEIDDEMLEKVAGGRGRDDRPPEYQYWDPVTKLWWDGTCF